MIFKNMMGLQEFIKKTLIDIKNGVSDANKEIKGLHYGMFGNDNKEGHIHFDVAVMVSNEKEKAGKGSVGVYIAKVGGGVSDKTVHENTSRIEFYIRIRTAIA